MGLGSEFGVVQDPLLRYATEIGWQYLSPEEAVRLRRGEASAVFWEVLVGQLQSLNSGVVDLERAEEVAQGLTRVHPSIQGNLDAWELLTRIEDSLRARGEPRAEHQTSRRRQLGSQRVPCDR